MDTNNSNNIVPWNSTANSQAITSSDVESSKNFQERTSVNSYHEATNFVYDGFKSYTDETVELAKEVRKEVFSYEALEVLIIESRKKVRSLFHIPYFPAFHRPGWLLRYLVGPYSVELLANLFSDFWAGITVALTLIPQVM